MLLDLSCPISRINLCKLLHMHALYREGIQPIVSSPRNNNNNTNILNSNTEHVKYVAIQ